MTRPVGRSARMIVFAAVVALVAAGAWRRVASAQTYAGFPEGFDAVQAAPASHHVVFENEWVRVLQVTLPPAGQAEPMHFHRYPSLFLGYDTGGRTPHIRYHTPGGKVVDEPATSTPVHRGVWTATWMKPEPMHSIETVEADAPGPGGPPGWLRVELKFAGK